MPKKKKIFTVENRFSESFDGKTKFVGIRFTAEEYAALMTMMKEDEWESVSGFIKYKVYGCMRDKVDNKFKSLVDDLKSKNELLWLVATLYPFIKQELDYINLQNSKRLMEFDDLKKSDKTGEKLYEILTSWNKEIKAIYCEFIGILNLINEKLDIDVKAEDYDDVSSIPLSVLNEYTRTHTEDAISPIAVEASRRSLLRAEQNEYEKEHDVFGFMLKMKLDSIANRLEDIERKISESAKE